MKKQTIYQPSIKLVTIKVTELAAENFRLAAAHSGKKQYEVSEEGSQFVCGKYLHIKKKVSKTKQP